jgi:hypothetical protein
MEVAVAVGVMDVWSLGVVSARSSAASLASTLLCFIYHFVCMLTVILCGLACTAGLRGVIRMLCVRVSGHALRRLTVAGNSVATVRPLPLHTRPPAHPRASHSCMRRCQVAGSCQCGDVSASLLTLGTLPNFMFDYRSVMRRCVTLPMRSRRHTFPSARAISRRFGGRASSSRTTRRTFAPSRTSVSSSCSLGRRGGASHFLST